MNGSRSFGSRGSASETIELRGHVLHTRHAGEVLVDHSSRVEIHQRSQLRAVEVPTRPSPSNRHGIDAQSVVGIKEDELMPLRLAPQVGEEHRALTGAVLEACPEERGTGQRPAGLDRGCRPCPRGDYPSERVKQVGVDRAIASRIFQVADLASIGSSIVRCQHPADQLRAGGLLIKRAKQRILEVVVDVADVLILHRGRASIGQRRPTADLGSAHDIHETLEDGS